MNATTIDRRPSAWDGRAGAGPYLRSRLSGAYWTMAASLSLTALVAAVVAGSPAIRAVVAEKAAFPYLAIASALLFALAIGGRFGKWPASLVRLALVTFATLLGVALAGASLAFAGLDPSAAIASAAMLFATLGLLVRFARKDPFRGPVLAISAVVALVIADLAHLAAGSSATQFAASIASILIFTWAIARHDGRMRELLVEREPDGEASAAGALSLHLSVLAPLRFRRAKVHRPERAGP
ncbi:Bax inhibitor-1 family protein [Sphingomonas lenta]|uniref:Uncharacterized protein n=1 Tax=Sphingomonas lenta TaxID=1141887 RepID=A0A2A2SCU4_9SPHN|nr:Bax inhibitor-1 family protein [Sphingomonas lenta]PAX07025.1 hypothetical protein CKY28_13285 [Sphingomonas lenta]